MSRTFREDHPLTDDSSQEVRPGFWDRSGPFEVLLDKASAIHGYSKYQDVYTVDKDHSNLVKFAENEPDLNAVLAFVKTASCAPPAPDNNGEYGDSAITHSTGIVPERTSMNIKERELWWTQGKWSIQCEDAHN